MINNFISEGSFSRQLLSAMPDFEEKLAESPRKHSKAESKVRVAIITKLSCQKLTLIAYMHSPAFTRTS
jgi:hypothetical protein